MIIVFFAYLLTFFAFLIVLKFKNIRYKTIENAVVYKYGVVFSSNKRHRIKIFGAKILVIDKNVYLKKNDRTVVIKNVDNLFIRRDYLYFNALGEVKIIMNCKKFYKYFCVRITSDYFDLTTLKQTAILDILNNIFDFNNCTKLKRYLKIMREILKIDLNNDHIKLTKNNYNLSYTLTYILNGQKKVIHVK